MGKGWDTAQGRKAVKGEHWKEMLFVVTLARVTLTFDTDMLCGTIQRTGQSVASHL